MYRRLTLMFALCLLTAACRTPRITNYSYEGRTATVERTDTIIERDSVLVLIREKADTVRIIQRETKWRERVTLIHDTLTVIQTDTVRIVEPKVRSPAGILTTVRTWLRVILATVVTIIIIKITLKIKLLWDKLI
ncbi:MAG: hypothetical protein J6W52_04460 [Bacteroidaceae bacterium]|nr:hypothetical protein [Bacteroidaceae bacterium]